MDTDRIVSAINDLADKFHGPLIDQRTFYERVLQLLKSIDDRLAAIEYNTNRTSDTIDELNREITRQRRLNAVDAGP